MYPVIYEAKKTFSSEKSLTLYYNIITLEQIQKNDKYYLLFTNYCGHFVSLIIETKFHRFQRGETLLRN